MITELGPTDEQIDSMRRNILQRTSPAGVTEHLLAPRARPARRRLGFATLAAGAAAALAIGTVLATSDPGGASAEAAEFLESTAEITIHATDPVVGPGQYLKVATIAVYGASTGEPGVNEYWMAPSSGELYIPYDRTDEWVWERHPLPPTVFYGHSRQIALQSYQDSLGDPDLDAVLRADNGDFYDTPHAETDFGSLPRDPAALRDYFYDSSNGGSSSPDEDAWARITGLLRTGEVPADLRAALYQTMALIPGVDILDEQVVLDGRTGTALGRVEPARGSTAPREEIIIDPATGLLIGERTVSTAQIGDIPAGTTGSSTSVETTVVDSAP